MLKHPLILGVLLATLLVPAGAARAWDGNVCIGPACFDIGQGCVWIPQDPRPVVMKGRVKRLKLRYGESSASNLVTPIGTAWWNSDVELDWHLYFDESRCWLQADGTCSKSIQTIGAAKDASEPTPIIELMSIQRWKRETTDYWVYSSTEWWFWSRDMTNPFLLKPGVAAEVDAFSKEAGDMEFGPTKTTMLGREAYAQGFLVIDRPDDVEGGHGHAEIHPLDGLAVKTSGSSLKSWTYRVSAFTNSTIHQIADCAFATAARNVEWYFAAPSVGSGKILSVQVSPLWPIAGVPTDILARLENDSKVVHVSIPLGPADEFGRIWVGDVTAGVTDFPLSLATAATYPKSLGYFDKNGQACAPCQGTEACDGNVTRQCRRRYGIRVETQLTLPAGFGHKMAFDQRFTEAWTVNGVPTQNPPPANPNTVADNWGHLEFNQDVWRASSPEAYAPVIHLDESIADPKFNGTASTQHTVGLPPPKVLFSIPQVTVASKTADTLTYKFTATASTNAEMAPPRRYTWLQLGTDGKTWSQIQTVPTWSATVTNQVAKQYDYAMKYRIQIDDAYRAERAEDTVSVPIPHLEVSTEVAYDPAKDGHSEGGLVPPLVIVPPFDYHTKWHLTAKAAMAQSEAPMKDFPVTWPVKYQWAITSGSQFLTSSKSSGTHNEVFDLVWKSSGIGFTDCVTVGLSASDAYGHTPSFAVSLCGGLSNEEAQELLAGAINLANEMKKKIARMKTKQPVGPPKPEPDPRVIVLGRPEERVSPLREAAVDLYNHAESMRRALTTKGPLRASTLRAISAMAPDVARVQALDKRFLREPAIERTLYVGTPAQRQALNRSKAALSPAARAHYDNDFRTLTPEAAKQMFPHGLKQQIERERAAPRGP